MSDEVKVTVSSLKMDWVHVYIILKVCVCVWISLG